MLECRDIGELHGNQTFVMSVLSQFQEHWDFLTHHHITTGTPTPWDFDIWARSQDHLRSPTCHCLEHDRCTQHLLIHSSDVAPLGLFRTAPALN